MRVRGSQKQEKVRIMTSFPTAHGFLIPLGRRRVATSSSIWEDGKCHSLAHGLSAPLPSFPSRPPPHLKAKVYRKTLSILLARPTLKGKNKT